MSRRPLSISLAFSALAHALIIAGLVVFVRNADVPSRLRLGDPVPLKAVLQRAAVKPDPAPSVEVASAVEPTPPAEVAPLVAPPPPVKDTPRREQPAAAASEEAAPMEAPMQPDATPAGESSPLPYPTAEVRGMVAVGKIDAQERLSPAQKKKIGPQYPASVSRGPQLRATLTVAYPYDALRRRQDQRILALLTLDERGRVLDTTLSPNDPQFGPAVLSALKDATFTPAEVGATQVPYWIVLEFVFKVDTTAEVAGTAEVPTR
ncbi:MAG: energy transducer TonB [Betaproteobacteria bacterium]|nr:energy transducer TonB [Betaproteobacteria bacterium]